MKKTLFLFLICTFTALSLHAQEIWQKSASEWSKDDVEKILNKSPWSTSQELRIRYQGGLRLVAGSGNIIFGDLVENQERNRRPILHLR